MNHRFSLYLLLATLAYDPASFERALYHRREWERRGRPAYFRLP